MGQHTGEGGKRLYGAKNRPSVDLDSGMAVAWLFSVKLVGMNLARLSFFGLRLFNAFSGLRIT